MVRLHADIEATLSPVDVLTSEELLAGLLKAGIGTSAARQLIKRASDSGSLWRSNRLRLPRNARLYARQEFAGTDDFYRVAAAKIAESERYGIARCLTALAEQGVLLNLEAQKLLAAPFGAPINSKHLTFSEELHALSEFGIEQFPTVGGRSFLASANQVETIEPLERLAWYCESRLRTECIIARILVDTLRRQNILSWNRYETASLEKGFVTYNDQCFTAYGYCYLGPVLKWDGPKPTGCPALIDVHAGICQNVHLESFLERIKRATHRSKTQQKYLGIVAALDFEKEVWDVARKHNLCTINLRQAYGKEALAAIAKIEALIRNFGSSRAPDDVDAESLARMLVELKTNPVVTDLRSIGFEASTALIVRANGFENVGMGQDVPFQNSTRDVDVFGNSGGRILIVECKAIMGGKCVLDSDVRKFFRETVPAFIVWYRHNRGPVETIQAEIWTTGEFDTAARAAVSETPMASNVTPYLRNRAAVSAMIPNQLRSRLDRLLDVIAIRDGDTNMQELNGSNGRQ